MGGWRGGVWGVGEVVCGGLERWCVGGCVRWCGGVCEVVCGGLGRWCVGGWRGGV